MSFRTVATDATAHFIFTTRGTDGVPATLGGTPVVDIYEDGGTTQITSAETLTPDFDSVTGLNHVSVDCSDAGMEAGKTYHGVITTGTVGGTSVVGETVFSFQMETASAAAARVFREKLYPTSGLIVTATGNTTSAINLTEVVDSSAIADDLNNEILAVAYVGGTYDGLVLFVVVTDYQVTNQLATVQLLGDGGAMPEAVAANDYVWRVGHAVTNSLTTGAQADVNAQADQAITDAFTFNGGNVYADVIAISGDSTAADRLEEFATAVLTGTASGTPTTTTTDSDLSGYADDELIGRTIVFTSGTAAGQAGRITDYANTSGVVTFTTLATAPAASDTFVIV